MKLWLDPLVWYGLTLAGYAVAVNGPWRDRWAPSQAPELWRSPAGMLRAAYLAGPPLLAIAWRVGAPGAMGLRLPEASWRFGLAALLVLAGAALLLTLLLREPRARASARHGDPAGDRRVAWWAVTAHVGRSGVEALLLEAHWAFVRAAALSVGLPRGGEGASGTNLGASLLLALLLLALEAAIDPRQRARWTLGDPRAARLGLLATTSMLVFALSLSSIAAWAVHWLLRSGWVDPLEPALRADAVGKRRQPSPKVESRPAREHETPQPAPDIEPTIV